MKTLSDSEFVRIWENSVSRYEVAKKCAMTGAAVGMRAAKLRDIGVNLKKFPSGRPKKHTDVASLNEIIESNF